MALTHTVSNHFKYQLSTGNVDLSSDTLKVILMDTSFAFDPDTHGTLSDVTASQLSTGNGYSQNAKVLSGVTLSEDSSSDTVTLECDDVAWTADGGSIGPIGAYIVYDDDMSDDTVIYCCDFGFDYTLLDGKIFNIKNINVSIG